MHIHPSPLATCPFHVKKCLLQKVVFVQYYNFLTPFCTPFFRHSESCSLPWAALQFHRCGDLVRLSATALKLPPTMMLVRYEIWSPPAPRSKGRKGPIRDLLPICSPLSYPLPFGTTLPPFDTRRRVAHYRGLPSSSTGVGNWCDCLLQHLNYPTQPVCCPTRALAISPRSSVPNPLLDVSYFPTPQEVNARQHGVKAAAAGADCMLCTHLAASPPSNHTPLTRNPMAVIFQFIDWIPQPV